MTDVNPGIGRRGIDVLHDPPRNRSSALAEAERQALGPVGLLPDVIERQLTVRPQAYRETIEAARHAPDEPPRPPPP